MAVNVYFLTNRVLQQSQSIPLYRAKDCDRLSYISSVAFVLSKTLNIPPLEIASAIASSCEQTKQDITVRVVTPGFIYLEPKASRLANWLQTLPFLPLFLAKSTSKEYFSLVVNNSLLFSIQHAHARCCSLLHQAEREGIIALTAIELNHWAIAQPLPLPWLDERSQLRFSDRSEYALVNELVSVCDRIYTSSLDNKHSWQAAYSLSQAFTSFHGCCRLWGDVKSSNLQLVEVRLGLILAVQVVLQFLLDKQLGVLAPQEL